MRVLPLEERPCDVSPTVLRSAMSTSGSRAGPNSSSVRNMNSIKPEGSADDSPSLDEELSLDAAAAFMNTAFLDMELGLDADFLASPIGIGAEVAQPPCEGHSLTTPAIGDLSGLGFITGQCTLSSPFASEIYTLSSSGAPTFLFYSRIAPFIDLRTVPHARQSISFGFLAMSGINLSRAVPALTSMASLGHPSTSAHLTVNKCTPETFSPGRG